MANQGSTHSVQHSPSSGSSKHVESPDNGTNRADNMGQSMHKSRAYQEEMLVESLKQNIIIAVG